MKANDENSVVLIFPKMQNPAKKWEAIAPVPVMAVAGSLLKNGYSVSIIDGNVENDYESALKKIKTPPICFGVSAMMGYQVVDALIWTRLINKVFPDTPVAWGGWFATNVPEETLKEEGISAVIRGQGEETFLEYVKALQNGDDVSTLPEVFTRGEDGIIDGGRRPAIDINDYPMLPYHLLDIDRYTRIKRGILNYASSYGCPNMCQFCSIHMLKQRRIHRGLHPDRVIEDLKILKSEYGARVIEFHEDEVLHDNKRSTAIFEKMVENNLDLGFIVNGRADDLLKFESDQRKLIKRAGAIEVGIGVESGSPSTLKRIRKGITPEQVIEVAHRFKEQEIRLRLNFMIAHYLETVEELKETFLLIEKLKKIDRDTICMLYLYNPLPGSRLLEEEVKLGHIVKPATMDEWSRYWSGHPTPWFDQEDKRFFKRNRDVYRIRSFYFALHCFNMFPPIITQRPGGKYLKALLALGARIRFQTDFYGFPLLWLLGREVDRRLSPKTENV